MDQSNKDLEESERIRLERKLLSEIPLEVGKKMQIMLDVELQKVFYYK